MQEFMVNLEEVQEGINDVNITKLSKAEGFTNLLEVGVRFSNGVEEILRIFNDVNKQDGLVRQLIKATIFEEGKKSYNLADVVGLDVVVDIEQAVSKKGNEFWKVNGFERAISINRSQECNSIDEIADILD
ncbi:hypothetical protein FDC27_08615 [Clostridium botulinum]|nr:hypothetical protein [Clostridium botulinum]